MHNRHPNLQTSKVNLDISKVGMSYLKMLHKNRVSKTRFYFCISFCILDIQIFKDLDIFEVGMTSLNIIHVTQKSFLI